MPTRAAIDGLLDRYTEQTDTIACVKSMCLTWLIEHPKDEFAAYVVILLSDE